MNLFIRHTTGDSDGDVNDNTTLAKSVAMLVLFVCSFALGTIPIKLSKWFNWKGNETKNNTYVKLLLCFGGGVLLCTTFLHVLPEVTENLENIEDFPDLLGLPFSELLMCIGFFIMYFIEELVHYYLAKKMKSNMLRQSISISRGETDVPSKAESSMETEGQFAKNFSHDHSHHHHHGHSHADHSHIIVIENTTIALIRGLLVVLALSVHELFEGFSVGLESSSGAVWYMFGAVSAHKLVIAFCIGVELVTSGMRNIFIVIYIFMFAVVSPMGIGIGLALTEKNESSFALISVILQGLASGTLLYIIFFEILRTDRKTGIKQYFAVLVGFIVMLMVTLLDSV